MGSSRDMELRRWGVQEMGVEEEFRRWGVQEMQSSRDGELRR